jgi:hypothetical protein
MGPDKWTIIKFIVITGLLITAIILMFTIGNIKEISQNFGKYRCNPLIMPFAANFGVDAKENFNFCLTNVFNSKAAEVFTPIYRLLAQFTETVTVIVNATLGIRQLFSNFFLSVNGFVGNVRNRIQQVLFQIRMSYVKMFNLMGKVYGTMYAVIWMGTSALTAGNNLANNDLVKFLFEFCFSPQTLVKMADGSYKQIQFINIGDILGQVKPDTTNPTVTSIFKFNGEKTPMVNINGIIVSAQHFVNYAGKMIQADNHPDAVPHNSIPILYCLNVSGNEFIVGGDNYDLIVSDYDEHTTPEIISIVKHTAENALNGGSSPVVSVTEGSYNIGIDPKLYVKMDDDSYKLAANIVIGDVLKYSGEVLGIVQEYCIDCVKMPSGCFLSESQLIYNDSSSYWVRADTLWPKSHSKKILTQFITRNCSSIRIAEPFSASPYFSSKFTIRDYREVATIDMETPYQTEFKK